MAAAISEHVPRILDEFRKCLPHRKSVLPGLPGHYRIEPREGRVEQ
jgi:hypothetical protein